jgi:hypothetical protein
VIEAVKSVVANKNQARAIECPQAFGTTLFCDDIRFEFHGKLSLVGVYGYEMVLFGTTFPVTLPKLGLFCAVRFHRSQKISGAKILIYFPEHSEESPTHVQEVPIQLTAEQFPPPDPSEYPEPAEHHGFNHPLLFSPAVVKQPGYIRVRVAEGSDRLKIGSLKIREASSEEIAQVAASTSS